MTNPHIAQDVINSRNKYIDQSTIDDARNAYGFGVPLDKIAGHIGITVGELRTALGMPGLKREPSPVQETEFDLWRADELKEVL